MKSITLHKLDDELSEALEKRAAGEQRSLNKLIKSLLRVALDLDPRTQDRRGDFEDLFGTWDEEDAAEFDARVQELSTVDQSEW